MVLLMILTRLFLSIRELQRFITVVPSRAYKGDLDGALADYEKAIELKPSLPSAFLGRGYFRYQKEDFDGALADFSKAIELKPDYADAHVDRGMVRGLIGEIDSAIADITKGVALNPRSVSDSDRE